MRVDDASRLRLLVSSRAAGDDLLVVLEHSKRPASLASRPCVSLAAASEFCKLNPRSDSDIELLYLWCKEGWQRSVLGEYHTQKQALSRFFVGAMLQTAPVLDVIRRELRRVSPDVKIDSDQSKEVLVNEVIKREVLEGDKADEARKKITRAANKLLRANAGKAAQASVQQDPAGADQTPG